MSELLVSGLILGLSNGISPGPLSNMIISETLLNGKAKAIRLSLAPFISDIFIISLAFLLNEGSEYLYIINKIIPFIGAIFISYLGIQGFRSSTSSSILSKTNKLSDAVFLNLVNPYPYIFWIFVGVPLLKESNFPILFLISFYGFFLLSKITIIYLVDLGLKNRAIKIKNKLNLILSVTMFYFAYRLIKMGLEQ